MSEAARDAFWLQGMMAGIPACYFCDKAFPETNLTEDLKSIRNTLIRFQLGASRLRP